MLTNDEIDGGCSVVIAPAIIVKRTKSKLESSAIYDGLLYYEKIDNN